jgi:putative oxidoreductase
MSAFLRKLEPYSFVVFRITVGGLFLFHGLQKLFGMFGGTQVPYLSRAGAAGIIELVGGVLVALGAWTVPTAVIASGEMAFAYYLGHYRRATWPIENGGELAALYCAAFLFIATHGPGRLSLDALMRRR